MSGQKEFKVPVSGTYNERVIIQTVDGPVTAILQVKPVEVSIFAPDEQTAEEMATGVIAQWSRNKEQQ